MTTKATTPPQTIDDPWCVCGYHESAHHGDARHCPYAEGIKLMSGRMAFVGQQRHFQFSYGLNDPAAR